MNRAFAIILFVLGLVIGIAGLTALPANPGRLWNAIEVVDPRPLAEASLPKGLETLDALPLVSVDLPVGPGPRRALLTPHLGKLVTSADTELGKIPERGAGDEPLAVVAGAKTGLLLGTREVKGVRVKVTALLHPLGPGFDDDILLADTPGARAALGVPERPGANARAIYLLPEESYWENRRLMARLTSERGLLPMPESKVITSARPPLLSDTAKRVLAIGFVCAGLIVFAFQLRGLTRDELSRRFARS